MTNSKLTSNRVLVPTVIIALSVGLTIWGLSPAVAAVNQTINSATSGYAQLPKIIGSVYAGHPPPNFSGNLKVSFPQAAEIAGKQIANGTVVLGQLGIVQGYLAYEFFVVNGTQMGYLTIVDAGNGKVLYTSQSLPFVA